jgi:hypothetical protein
MLAKLGSEEALSEWQGAIGHKGGSKLNTKPKGFAYAKLHYPVDHPAHPATAGNVGGLKSKRPSASE